MIHVDTRQITLHFKAYPSQDVYPGEARQPHQARHLYTAKDEDLQFIKYAPGECLKHLIGCVSYNGIWNCDVSFTQDEYSSEEVDRLVQLLQHIIKPWCQKFIAAREKEE